MTSGGFVVFSRHQRAVLTMMEISGLVKRVPGGKYGV
jgi:hypothetical protein